MSVRIQLRRDTAANWASTNPTLTQGEPGYETDTGKIKYGDGTTAWNSLAYAPSAAIVDGTIVNADVNASAAIAGTKISPDFGSQTITTTGLFSHALGSAAAPTITFTGDTNTGIYSPGADQVALATNGVGRLFVDDQGRVGVGGAPIAGSPNIELRGSSTTSGPSLGVTTSNYSDNFTTTSIRQYGTAATSTTAGLSRASLGELVFQNTSAGLVRTNGAAPIVFAVTDSERMRLTSDGRLGLGTSSPSANLESQGNVSSTTLFSGFQGLRIQNANGSAFGVSADINLVAGTGSDNRGAAIGAIYDSATSGNHLYFATNGSSVTSNDTLTERLRITAAGNVGIGTTNPSKTLDVRGDVRFGAADANACSIELGSGATGNRAAFIDLTGDTTYTDYGLRMERTSGGADGISRFLHRGTGEFRLIAQEAAPIVFWTSNGEKARIDSTGRLLVGTSTAFDKFFNGTNASQLQVQGSTTMSASISSYSTENNSNGPAFILGKSKAGGAVTIDGDSCGLISFQGHDGTELVESARIQVQVDGTPGANDMPGRLVFSTTADGASSPTEQIRITSDRYIRLASGTGGIQFNGDTAAANALDDYEEGTFTPTIVGTSTAGTGTYTAQVGRYTKIGNRVLFSIQVTWTAHTGTGKMDISGLPFTSQSTAGNTPPPAVSSSNLTTPANAYPTALVVNNTNVVRMYSLLTGGGTITLLDLDTAATIYLCGHYETA